MISLRTIRRALLGSAALLALTCSALPSRAQVILPLGDSITYGFLSFGQPYSAGYRYQLFQDLGGAASGYSFVGSQSSNGTTGQPQLPSGYTANEGHNGYTINGIDLELTGNTNVGSRADSNNGGHWLDGGNGTNRSAINPSIVLLTAGTNDATDANTSDPLAQAATAAQMLSDMKKLMDDLKLDLPSAEIFIGNITPRVDNSGKEAAEEIYNAGLPALVAGEGATFHFVDLHSAVSSSNINAADGVGGQHPNLAGYQQMGDAWYKALVTADVVPEPSSYAMIGTGLVALFFFARRRLNA